MALRSTYPRMLTMPPGPRGRPIRTARSVIRVRVACVQGRTISVPVCRPGCRQASAAHERRL